jgi:hypothetical protein
MYGRADQKLVDDINKLQNMMQNVQRSSAIDPQSRLSQIEIDLVHCAHQLIVQGTAMFETSTASAFNIDQSHTASQGRVMNWLESLEAIKQDQKLLVQLNMTTQPHLAKSEDRASIKTNRKPTKNSTQLEDAAKVPGDDSDDDLDTDLVKAALATGTQAFEAQNWNEADSLLNEALLLLQQLRTGKRLFCDIFDLHYKLAICTYHTQKPFEAEVALKSLVRQPVTSDDQRGNICNATHLLSQLYIRTGQIDLARSECEKALQTRRRLLGKQHDASLQSLALMAHIYVLQNNRALAKSCLSMIPEVRREAVLAIVEAALGPTLEHLDFSSLLTPPMPQDMSRSEITIQPGQNRMFGSPKGLGVERQSYGASSTTTESPASSPLQFTQRLASEEYTRPIMPCTIMPSGSSAASIAESTLTDRTRPLPSYAPEPTTAHIRTPQSIPSTPSTQLPRPGPNPPPTAPTRSQILSKLNCHPRDRIESAVCASDLPLLTTLLTKKKSFWRPSSLRKRIRPERITALHFSALFGETDMARRLLDAGFNINEIPFGYTSSLTPLHFAIGARQVEMVDFLITHGAGPAAEGETWATLAGQLLSRSWLVKTMADAERDVVPNRILAIMGILIKAGWNVNDAIDATGKTVLHQAVGFWTGAYRWDLDLRANVTAFLWERGADSRKADRDDKTPYDLAVESEHWDLVVILERGERVKERDGTIGLAELPGNFS